ncbi:T9SS type A sorting domain-containing protein [uncultured Algibacter sp.]|uniref:T9SS type A sorting domain-containing protein n=1 Tax=uncultured Algibacter sp. TaxID=298659 RepID=UPI0026069685|nr:T9SS type A sorting domain-containing protein [uncultured Algibacter sp.]
MKKITFLLFLISSVCFSQASHTIDFEPAGTGSGWNWTASDAAPSFSEIANPVSGGINTSATVVEFTAYTTDNNWALCHTDDDGEFTFDASNSTVKIMVYKPTISVVAVKFEGLSPAIELQESNTVINQWEELTFDFSAQIGNTYSKIVIIPDFVMPYVDGTDRTTDNTLYFDNIVVPDGTVTGPLPAPTTAPTAPAHDETANQVISIYSDAYTDLAGSNFNPGWGQSTSFSFETIAGNQVAKYAGLNYQGTNLGSADGGVPQDVSAQTHLHVDFWTPNSTGLNFYILDQSAGELGYALPITTETWVSVDIPLSYFTTGGESLTDIHQFKVDGNGTVYFDNWYFYNETALSAEKFNISDVKIYPNPTINVWNIKADNININSVKVLDVLGKQVLTFTPDASEVVIDGSTLKSGIYFAQIKTDNGTSSVKLIKK